MVKKITMAKQAKINDDVVISKDTQEKVLEYLNAIDWKLWELLKIEQSKVPSRNPQADVPVTSRKTKIKPIIIEDDE